jgi:hypothetical protein
MISDEERAANLAATIEAVSEYPNSGIKTDTIITVADYDGGPETKLFQGEEEAAHDAYDEALWSRKYKGRVLVVYPRGGGVRIPIPVTRNYSRHELRELRRVADEDSDKAARAVMAMQGLEVPE